MNRIKIGLLLTIGVLTSAAHRAHAETKTEVNKNWGLSLTNTFSAWEISQGSSDVTVAIIDTGIDVNHPSLRENLWVNPGETLNGLDDDGNGYIDDIHGWNFADNSNDLTDRHGHGTHVAGIIQGSAPKVKLMILKYYDSKATGAANLLNTVKAIQYATKMKARIINYSGGGTDKYREEEQALQRAQAQKILVVAAAGNERNNSDIIHFYPADYGYANIVSVTAIDENQRVLSSSNYGIKTVDIAAPGKDIYSTLPGGKFGTMTGTSQATAFVTGAAALWLGQNPGVQDPEKVISILTKTGFQNDGLIGKTKNETRLDMYRTLIMKDRDQDAFGDFTANSTTRSPAEFSAKLDSKVRDLGDDELPFKKISSSDKIH
jgi:thermitase